MLPSFLKDTIIRLRPGTREVRGQAIADWSAATELTITGCSVQPANTALFQDGRELGITDSMTIYAPAGADIVAGDRIKIGDAIYDINGDALTWNGAANISFKRLNLTGGRG